MLSIYKASAGSGKTYNLVLEYIRLLIGVKDPDTGRYKLNPRPDHAHRHILAVTFTNKSTEEMKQRIITELAQLALLEPVNHAGSKYTAPLMNEFGCTESDLVKSAQTALRQLIYDYNFFRSVPSTHSSRPSSAPLPARPTLPATMRWISTTSAPLARASVTF